MFYLHDILRQFPFLIICGHCGQGSKKTRVGNQLSLSMFQAPQNTTDPHPRPPSTHLPATEIPEQGTGLMSQAFKLRLLLPPPLTSPPFSPSRDEAAEVIRTPKIRETPHHLPSSAAGLPLHARCPHPVHPLRSRAPSVISPNALPGQATETRTFRGRRHGGHLEVIQVAGAVWHNAHRYLPIWEEANTGWQLLRISKNTSQDSL